MKPIKHGKKYQINYRCPGYPKTVFEMFDTEEEAELRISQIKLLKKQGKLTPPIDFLDPNKDKKLFQEVITVRRLMEEYVKLYGLNHWSAGTMSCNLHRIEDYILPYIGDYPIRELTTHKLEHFYNLLLSEPAKHMEGHKDEGKTISISVVEKVHAIIRSALNQAVRWGYLDGANPAMTVELPKVKKQPREVWTAEEASRALEVCTDPTLKICMLMALGCSMRIGEVLGLTWDSIHITDQLMESQECYLQVTKELRRCDKSCVEALEQKGRSDVQFVFPTLKQEEGTTLLVLKAPKTESSVRNIYLADTLVQELQQLRTRQEEWKATVGTDYQDFNLEVAQDNGRPYEQRLIAKMFKDFLIRAELPVVVFHSLRHCSTGLKLRASGGDIKAVQGDTGHAQSNMVTDVYSHIMTDDRIRLAKNMEQQFFSPIFSKPAPTDAAPATSDPQIAAALEMMERSPELANLVMQMAQMMAPQMAANS